MSGYPVINESAIMPEDIAVKWISETEVMVGPNKACLLEDKIILVTVVGPQPIALATIVYEVTRKLEQLAGGRVSYLIDLNRAGKNSPEANRLWKHAAEEEQVYRVAQFGLHPVAKVLASFVNSLSAKNSIRFFNTMDEGLQWIKE